MRFGYPAIAAVILSVACAVPALAEDVDHPTYIGVLAGYSWPERDEFDTRGNGINGALLWGNPISDRFAFEVNLNGSIFETGAVDETDYYQTALVVNLVYNFREHRGETFTPYAIIGGGIAHNDLFPDSRDTQSGIFGAGLGFVTGPLNELDMRFRMEARYVHNTVESGHGEPRVSIGIEFPLHHAHPEKIHPPIVETRTIERVREVPRPWIDTDGDGVDDEHDRCPGTPVGLRADATGCVIENQSIELVGVTFEFAQARLTANATTILDQMAENLSTQKGLRLEIAGHTDSVGSQAANKSLSARRAESVRAYLISKGVPPDTLTSAGYGESQPLVDPELTPDDAERNRRVELRVLSAPKESK